MAHTLYQTDGAINKAEAEKKTFSRKQILWRYENY